MKTSEILLGKFTGFHFLISFFKSNKRIYHFDVIRYLFPYFWSQIQHWFTTIKNTMNRFSKKWKGISQIIMCIVSYLKCIIHCYWGYTINPLTNTWCPLKDHTYLNYFQLQVCLSMYEPLVSTRRYVVNYFVHFSCK